MGQGTPRDGHASLDQRPDFLRFVQGRNDSALDLWRVFLIFGVALGKDQRAGQVAQQSTLVFWVAAECAAFFSVSHRIRRLDNVS